MSGGSFRTHSNSDEVKTGVGFIQTDHRHSPSKCEKYPIYFINDIVYRVIFFQMGGGSGFYQTESFIICDPKKKN